MVYFIIANIQVVMYNITESSCSQHRGVAIEIIERTKQSDQERKKSRKEKESKNQNNLTENR